MRCFLTWRKCANKHFSIVKWHVRIPGSLEPQERADKQGSWQAGRTWGCIVRNVCEVGREV